MNKKIQNIIIPAAFWVLVWAICAALVDRELILPSPAAAAQALLELARTGAFWRSLAASLARVGCGFLLGCALGMALGALTWGSKWCGLLLSPALRAVRTVPVVSFILLLFFWFPTGWVPAAVSALMALPVVWRSAVQGLAAADPALLELSAHYRLGRWRTFRFIRLPAALDPLSAGWETALGLAWKSGAAAEVLCQPQWGLGSGLQGAKSTLDAPGLFAWTAALVALSLLTEGGLKALLRRMRGGKA